MFIENLKTKSICQLKNYGELGKKLQNFGIKTNEIRRVAILTIVNFYKFN